MASQRPSRPLHDGEMAWPIAKLGIQQTFCTDAACAGWPLSIQKRLHAAGLLGQACQRDHPAASTSASGHKRGNLSRLLPDWHAPGSARPLAGGDADGVLTVARQRWDRAGRTHRFIAKIASSACPACACSYQIHPAGTKKAAEAACASTPKLRMLLRVAQMAQAPSVCAVHSFHHPTMPRADKAHMPSSAWRRQVVRWRNTA